MHNLLTDLSAGRTALLTAVPLLYLIAAIGPGLTGGTAETRWRLARTSAGAATVATLLSFTLLLVGDAGLFRGPMLVSLGKFGALHLSLRSDALNALMLVLVSFIGWVIVGYSQPYLHGEHGQARYIRGLMLTLTAVALQVMTNNLLVLALAWVSASLALHGLLTFFNTRPQALVAAHKNFIASKVADVCLIAATVLVGQQLGTLEIDQAIAAAKSVPELTIQLQAAALLFATSALLKCAQLPVHGWLIQVMEAPTPVSALLHAGVVNLGGFLLIRLDGLVGDVPIAQGLLVVVGSTTAVVAALVMMTRISIKVSLAWSTCAQMGFMMMQCGLGLYDLALLHLLAHSLYKAHAFLGAGGAVAQNRLKQMTPQVPPLPAILWFMGALIGMALVAAAAFAWGFNPAHAPALWAVGAILSLALAQLVARPLQAGGGLQRLTGLLAAFGAALAYFGLHAVFGRWLGLDSNGVAPSMALIAWVLFCFGLLFIVQGTVGARPHGALARGLYPWLFAGLYFDELFTRLTFWVWPARTPATPGTLIRRSGAQRSPSTLSETNSARNC